ncbi:alpha-amylase family glycosyl hydrolase [Longimicrobium sp.]|uniref:alpha-amylase family glycosyl hydrolase n=1 Tax=Longimicrobium sp. TaxID=2029185 RepID=UPI002BF5DA30|nr:alpha-amylase family glycosyl hydrolase [Longimicrobium sp.]HSU14075.1 alpha-amylase family glycosyl hydrolase [Longimicrobium sp.]
MSTEAEAGADQAASAAPPPHPSAREGMGAVPYADEGGGAGVAFRVWAPHADGVSVSGSFNGNDPGATPLAPEGDGYWSADVSGAGPGDEYKFAIHAGGETTLKRDPYVADIGLTDRRCVVYDPGAFDWGSEPWFTPAWNELVIYELHVGTFNDPRAGGAAGTFDSVRARLPYLRDLGANCIELMPSVEFAGDFSWGYNPGDIFAIESVYGGPDALKRLVRAAHEHGIAVIFDVVYNHFGPGDLDLWRFDGWAPAEGKGGIYFYNDERSSTPWGDTRPDYGRPEVRRFIRDNALRWLEEFRFDGLRWDATAYIRNLHGNNDSPASDIADGWRLMQEINAETDARQGWKLHIAEDLRGNGWVVRAPELGGAGFDTQWESEFVHPVRRAVIQQHDWQRSMDEVRRAIENRYEGDAFKRVIYTESHDEVANGHARVPEEIWPGSAGSWYSRKRSTLAAALVFTAPGIPMIFQGQEILEDRWFADGDPIDWTKLETFAGIHRLYGDLMKLRRDWWDTTRGLRGQNVHVHHVNDADKVIAFHRWSSGGPGDDVVVVLNFADRSYDGYWLGMPRGGEWKVRFNSDWTGYGEDFLGTPSNDTRADGAPMHGMPHSAAVGMGPYTAVILSQDE